MSEGQYVVMTMCHCDNFTEDGMPNEDCYDHWAVAIPVSGYNPDTGNVGRAKDMTKGFSTRADAQLFADAKNVTMADNETERLRSLLRDLVETLEAEGTVGVHDEARAVLDRARAELDDRTALRFENVRCCADPALSAKEDGKGRWLTVSCHKCGSHVREFIAIPEAPR